MTALERDHGKMTIPGDPPFFLRPQPRFVTCRGGEYLIRPSIGALRALADGVELKPAGIGSMTGL
jgi:hypothetical protein